MSGPSTQQIEIGTTFGGTHLLPAGCPVCDRTLLVPSSAMNGVCPACGRGKLEPGEVQVSPQPPELMVPFVLDEAAVAKALSEWLQPVWFKTSALRDPKLLASRAVKLWWPRWLVDAQLAANWSGQVGYDYQVESHIERFSNGDWSTEAVIDTRIRWEDRYGQLIRPYDNAVVQALSDEESLTEWIGQTDTSKAIPVPAGAIDGTCVRVADLDTGSVWHAATSALRNRAGLDVQQAAGAEHIRQFSVDASYADVNWTWMLCPVWATWYEDDSGTGWVILVNGQTGACGGARLASNKKGWLWASGVLSLAAVLALIGLVILLIGVVLVPLLVVAAVVLVIAFVIACLAIWPAVKPWRWNKRERGVQPLDVAS